MIVEEGGVRTIPLGREALEMNKSQLAKAVSKSLPGGLSNTEENDEDGDPKCNCTGWRYACRCRRTSSSTTIARPG